MNNKEISMKKIKIKKIPIANNGLIINDKNQNSLIDLNLNPINALNNYNNWNNTNPVVENNRILDQPIIETSGETTSLDNTGIESTNNVGSTIKALMPKVTLSTAPIVSAVSGMVNYMEGINTKRREQEMFAKNLRPVVEDLPVNQGLDMPMYMKDGGQVDSKTSLPLNSNSEGYTDNNYETPLEASNVIVEKGETIVHPDGGQTYVKGDKHSDPSGGEYRNYPDGSRVFSKKLKASKNLISSILGGNSKRRVSYAELVKKFDTTKENDILENPNLTSINQRTAEINKQAKLAKVEQIFDEQETVNGNKEKEALEQQILAEQMMIEQMGQEGVMDNNIPQEELPLMSNGGKVKIKSILSNIQYGADGVELRGGYKGQGNIKGYSENQVADYLTRLRNYVNQYGYTGDISDVGAMQDFYIKQLPNDVVEDYLLQQVPPANNLRRIFNLSGNEEQASNQLRELYKSGKINIDDLRKAFVDNIPGVRLPEYVQKSFTNDDEYMGFRTPKPELNNNTLLDENFDNTNNPVYYGAEYTPDSNYLKPTINDVIEGKLNPYSVTKPNLSTLGVTGKDLDRVKNDSGSSKNRLNVAKKIKDVAKQTVNPQFSAMFDYLPEMVAAGLAMNNTPIYTAKYQPKYNQREEMNIQPALNRTFSQGQPLIEGNTGNASIDNARANQVLANIYSADNEMFMNKFNFDTQNRQQVSNMNNQIENQANQFNIQNAIQLGDKMAARDHHRNIELNRITDSAYAKSKALQGEKRALNTMNQMMFKNLQVDANGNPYYLPVNGVNDLMSVNPYYSTINMINMSEEERRKLYEQQNKSMNKTAKQNNGTLTNQPVVQKYGGSVKNKLVLKRK